jgi:hypothetical protein
MFSLAGAMCSRRERASSTCQGRRTTALPSPFLDTLGTSARAHEVAACARASPSSGNHCEGRVPLVLPNGHGTLPSVHGVRVSHSHEKQAPEPGKPEPSKRGARLSATGIRSHRREIKSFLGGDVESTYRIRSREHSACPGPLSTRRHDRRSYRSEAA